MACSRRLAVTYRGRRRTLQVQICRNTGNDGIATRASMAVNKLLLALGANMPAAWGSPRQTLQRAELELRRAGLRTLSVSHVYDTLPLGPGWQAPYVNAVLLLHAAVSPAALLRLVKKIERRAGR